MTSKKTIVEAIKETLERSNKPLSIKSIYDYIIENDLYHFKAEDPQHIVQIMIRRHAEGLDFPSAHPKKYFRILLDGTYWLVNDPVPGQTDLAKSQEIRIKKDSEAVHLMVNQLKDIHTKHSEVFKVQIINQLKEIDPKKFETFAKQLLEEYGFSEMKVTKYSKDGGIDGYGELKIGLTHLNVAFQCKRWNKTNVSRTEIDKFRGAIDGLFAYGIIFTTSNFVQSAIEASRRKGALPIILINGGALVDIMIEKQFGIESEEMPVYINALDKVLTNEL